MFIIIYILYYKNMYSRYKIEREALTIYYISKKDKVRFGTGIKKSEWDGARHQLKESVENYQLKHEALVEQKRVVDDIIQRYKLKGVAISPDMLKEEVETYNRQNKTKLTADVLSNYEKFWEEKRAKFKATDKMISLKDYTSLFNAFKDYDKENESTLLIKHLTEDWFKKFQAWLSVLRPEIDDESPQEYFTRGGLEKATIKKRFDTLSSFILYLRNKGLMDDVTTIKEYKKKIKVPATIKEYLTKEEIYSLYDFSLKSESETRIKEMFVFSCLTGCRFGDLQTITYENVFENENGGWKLVKMANKTDELFAVPLSNLAYEIFEKNGFEFRKISNQKANYILKKLLKKSNLFNSKSKKYNKSTGKYRLKHEVLSFHRGRDTFINNLVETTPLAILMKYTGHRKIETLQKYLDAKDTSKTNYVKQLER